jgi:hypothetical protein
VLDTVLRLDLQSSSWTVYTHLPSPRWFHASDIDDCGCLAVYGGCTTVDYGSARSDQLHFIHLDVQSLQLIAWQVLTADGRGRQLAAIDPKRLLSIGFPATFVDQLYF